MGVESFPGVSNRFEDLLVWLVGFGPVVRVGVGGAGSWSVGLARYLTANEVIVVEVDRPNRPAETKGRQA